MAHPSAPAGVLELVGWPRLLSLANLCFGIAAALLSAQLISVYLLDGPNLFSVSCGLLLFSILCAWPVLFAAVTAFARSGREILWEARLGAVLAVVLGLVGFAAGMATLPWAFPAYVGGYFGLHEWQAILMYGLFPYVPTVFGSVVASHAVLDALAARQCGDAAARWRFRVGAWLLIAVTATSLTVQVAGLFHGWAWGLVCLTAPGYFVASLGGWREHRARATATPWPGPAGPSRGPWP